MLSILMLGLGLGTTTVIVTVFYIHYCRLLKNTYTGVKMLIAIFWIQGKGRVMTRLQNNLHGRITLSLSVIMAGIRNALVCRNCITAIGTFMELAV